MIIRCEDVSVAVPIKVLMQESPYFKSMLDVQQSSGERLVSEKKRET